MAETPLIHWISLILAVANVAMIVILARRIAEHRKQEARTQHRILGLISNVQKNRMRRIELKNKKDLLESTVDDGASAVEAVHKTIADTTFDVIDSLASDRRLKARSQQIRKIHDQTSSGVYRSVKEVNKHVGLLADNFLKHAKSRSNSESKDDDNTRE